MLSTFTLTKFRDEINLMTGFQAAIVDDVLVITDPRTGNQRRIDHTTSYEVVDQTVYDCLVLTHQGYFGGARYDVPTD